MSDEERHLGGCLCGAVRYELAGAPLHASICYCTQCQRQTGSPVPAFVTYTPERLTITSGSPSTYRSSPGAQRLFCATCGSCLFWREEGANEVDVFAGTLDNPRGLPTPSYALWALHRAPWVPEFEGIPSYATRRDDASD